MAFWGIEVKPGKPVIHSCEKTSGRLRITQAMLGIGDATKKSILQCNVGKRTPVLICALFPNQTESCQLDLEFEESYDVMFSVIGPRSVFLSGYYVAQSQLNHPQSDTESFGVDIQNSQSDGSNYCSDEDKYEDSFIDDNEVQVCSPSPDVSSQDMDESTPENDKLENGKARVKRLTKKFQVVESDDEEDGDANSSESEDDDGFLLSIFKNKKAAKTTASTDDGEKIAPATVHMGEKAKDNVVCDRKSNDKLDPIDKNGELEREVKGEAIVENDVALINDNVHGNDVEVNIIDQNLPMCNGENQMKSGDLEKPTKKRKKHSEKTSEIQDKDHEVEAPTNMDVVEHGSGSSKKSKKRRKKVNLEGTSTEGTVEESNNVGKDCALGQGLVHDDSTMKDLPAENGDKEQQIDNDVLVKCANATSQPEKKCKKKTKNKTQGEGGSNMGSPNQTENANPIRNKTLSNGLTIEEVTNGLSDGKVAAPGKKVKIYYTAMLKENGHVFDSNVGKTACKFRLGDERIIEGWNLGIDGMHVGDKRRLIVPPSMSVGKYGAGENIPPKSWLVYDVELVGVRK
ncbi:PREDICTED: LOW QUALITY PROTEIN: peptidyl-prolyl cis-trans isomerase FKBP43 [Erythranthe guttata]|uniref:LOW QUALITY PROTEIN: peptidyl-prolyl cis-trans isomerase FKBP43 n=1 Tax=Erythranthe guttata TaxID=4155 RepID=UPI00064D7FB9|nr:PREDICTED: LOW QUALITY PROTEIN: peptidyl-prolyl cis-trans isomerase FKBP43 [Erythranthe guttata]|eukprot:XP_012845621.1 PREDICTED: LOW QUALITY PROTEIN: peptidyl-prolyl cis-trans isomerase FKBP43 [Erythranthe guttata]